MGYDGCTKFESRRGDYVNVRPVKKKKSGAGFSGGSATGGGVDFQAATTACLVVAIASGDSLNWLEGIDDRPVAVDAETQIGGGDIGLTLRGGQRVDIQVKRGLRADARLWSALKDIAQAIHDGTS